MAEDPRFERLPKWAQQQLLSRGERIIRLENELAQARALLNAGPEDGPVVIDPDSANKRLLAERTPVEFRYKPEGDRFWSYFQVRLADDNRLEVHASSGIAVYPSSGNAASIGIGRR